MFLAKLNKSGTRLWSKTVRSQGTASQLDKFLDATEVPGGYVAVGYTLEGNYIPVLQDILKPASF